MALTRNLYFDARAGFGKSFNSIIPAGLLEDRFNTDRQLYRAELTGQYLFRELQIAPSIAALYFKETQHAFTDRLGVAIGSQSVSLGQLTIGPEFAYDLPVGASILTPRLRVEAVYDFHRDVAEASFYGIGLPTTALRGRVEGGFDWHDRTDFALSATASYDGIGDGGFSAITGRLAIKKSFDTSTSRVFAP